MLTGDLKNKIDTIWNAFWTGGIANPIEVIEQITFLIFMRRLDDAQSLGENRAARLSNYSGKNINLAILRDLRIPAPSLPLQQSFATRIQAVEALKTTNRAALTQLDALFASLQHRAFSGKL